MVEEKEEAPMELEGIVRSVGISRRITGGDLLVLIDKDGLLYNTVLRAVHRELDETAIEQLCENIKPGDRIKVSIVKDLKYVGNLPLYRVESQYQIIKKGDSVIVVSGQNIGVAGQTDSLRIITV